MSSRNLSSGQFPTMGESAVHVNYRPAEKGMLMPRSPRNKETAPEKTAVPREQVQERYGHVGGVQVYKDYSNCPEASGVGRRVKPIGASHSTAAFDCYRDYGQGA
jgi:hypothetical protein